MTAVRPFRNLRKAATHHLGVPLHDPQTSPVVVARIAIFTSRVRTHDRWDPLNLLAQWGPIAIRESDRAHWNRKVRAEQGLAARQALAHDLLR